MSLSPSDVLVAAVGAAAIAGALAVVFARDVMRLMLGLGTVFLSVAALFGLLGAVFLAVAEVFVYVGGVLVLFLFAIMLVHRSAAEKPALESRHDLLAGVIALGVSLMLVTSLSPLLRRGEYGALGGSTESLAEAFVGSQVAQFEIAGLLLLTALVAVVTIVGGERK